MPNNKYSPLIDKYEKQGKFDGHITPPSKNYRKLDPAKYRYLPKNFIYLIIQFIIRLIAFIAVPFVTFFGIGLKVKGRKKLKALKGRGAIIVANHVLALESLGMRQLSYFRNVYYISLVENYFKGPLGPLLKMGGLLPLPEDIHLAKQLEASINKITNRGFVIIYAEQSLWTGYEKIRPLKKGAFFYSAKLNKPIVPVVTLFRKPKWYDKLMGRNYGITMQVLDPIYPNKNVNFKTNVNNLLEQTHSAMVQCANEHYGVDSDATHYVEK